MYSVNLKSVVCICMEKLAYVASVADAAEQDI